MWERWIAPVAPLLASAALAVAEPPPGSPVPVVPSPYSSAGPIISKIPGPAVTVGHPLVEPSWAATDDAGGCTRFWGGAEYLLWWIKDGPVSAPLVTTGNPNDPAPGALGQPGTVVLFSGRNLDYGTLSGLRATAGAWLDQDRTIGVEASGFFLEQRSVNFASASDATGNPPVYLPVFRADLGREGSFTVSDPVAVLTGAIAVKSQTRLRGAEVNGVVNLARRCNFSADLIGGFRYLDLRENLTVDQSLFDPVNTISDVTHDGFDTRNQFYGGQVGGRVSYKSDSLSLDLAAKVGLGANCEVVNVNGFTVESGAGSPNPGTFAGGVFAQPTNSGRRTQTQFVVVPEIQAKVGYFITPNVQAFVGYDFLYWNQVVRPGSQIDHNVNPTQTLGGTLVGSPSPTSLFSRTDFWAQGVTFGLELRF
jgi:hypothetical protein